MASVSRKTLTHIPSQPSTSTAEPVSVPRFGSQPTTSSPAGEEETSHEVKRPSFLNVPTVAPAPEKHVKIGAVEVGAPKTLTPCEDVSDHVFPMVLNYGLIFGLMHIPDQIVHIHCGELVIVCQSCAFAVCIFSFVQDMYVAILTHLL